ncbi:hypothetical protein [Bradyrhizobium sp. ORS 86]|uniref:hypothetical protein n=1 Tax=Bradyrhizobium sp. ORS 86 TaxID=1685970 RepID=UPI00388F722D
MNYFNVAQEMHDAVTSNFAIAGITPIGQCPAEYQFARWDGIATALHQSQRGADALIAKRVASEIRSSRARFERLSAAYRTVLSETWTRSKPAPAAHIFTSDKYAAYIGNEYRAVLNALYGLRDAILAATHRLGFRRQEPFNLKKLKQLIAIEATEVAKLISDSMFSSSGDLLIDHMSLYRSIAQHCLGTTSPIFGDVYQLRRSNGPYGELRYLVYPLYDDIEKMRAIERGASQGVLEPPSDEEIKRFGSLGHYRDALEFCYDCFHRLLRIADLLQQEAGIAPQVLTLTEEQILELTITDATGKVTRVGRDENTGRLVEEERDG